MKKIIVALLCVANVTCLAMNNNNEQRKVDALELLAASHAMQTCLQIKEHNSRPHVVIEYDQPSCLLLSTKFTELVKKQGWK